MKRKSVAVVIITNGPGELSTWVRPVVDYLNKINDTSKNNDKLNFSIRLVLVPCPNATGKEYEVAKSWRKFELVTEAKTMANRGKEILLKYIRINMGICHPCT